MKKTVTLLVEPCLPGGSVAIHGSNGLNEVMESIGGPSSPDGVLTRLDELLEIHNLSKHDLKEVIFTRGPGGYTGIRVALSIVQGLKRSLNIEVYGYPLFDVLLFNETAANTAAAIDAGRDEILVQENDASPNGMFFVKIESIKASMYDKGIRKLILSSKHATDIQEAVGHSVLLSDASDNVTEKLFYFHSHAGPSEKRDVTPIYGREFKRL